MAGQLPGIGSHHSALRKSDEWYTPAEVLDALPSFDLDPCSPPGGALPWQRVGWTLDVTADGMSEPWAGHVWLNPPYSEADRWMARLADHDDGIALVFARTETAWWFESVWGRARSLLFIKGRVTFWRPKSIDELPTTLWLPAGDEIIPSKAGHNSGGPSVLIAYGRWAEDALEQAAEQIAGAHVKEARRGR